MSKFDSSQETYEEYLRRNRLDHKLKKRVKSNDQEKKVISFQEAKKNKAKLPITEIIDKYYYEIQKNGGNRWDTSSLISLLK